MNEQLQSLRDHLLSRSCDPDLYHVHVDESARVATFMLFALSGVVAGYQTYRPEGIKNTSEGRKLGLTPRDLKYFTYVSRDATKTPFAVTVFGMERFDFRKKTLYVVEGIFDAVKLHSMGLNAIAVLCNVQSNKQNKSELRGWLDSLSMHVVGVLDNDPAGLMLAKVCDEYFVCPPGRDPGDMTTDELKELLLL